MKKRRPLPHFRSIVRQLSLAGGGAVVLLILLVTACSPSKSTYHSLFLRLSSNDSAARHLQALTRRPHVAGSEANAAAAAYVLETLSSASIPAHIVSYDVLLSYPVHRYLSLSSEATAPSVSFDLVQEIYPGDPYADVAAEVLPTFHAYAHSGTAAGEVVYANYGRIEDFDKLRAAGVNVAGSVVLARYGGIFRGDIIRNAQLAGAIAAIVYTDAKDYGGGARGKWFPNDRWMPPSGVQVGSVFRGLAYNHGDDRRHLGTHRRLGSVLPPPLLRSSLHRNIHPRRLNGRHNRPCHRRRGLQRQHPLHRKSAAPQALESLS